MDYQIHFETLGCRLNQIESESAARFFSDAGFAVHMENISASAEPDENVLVCVVNTCTVTTKAEQKARRTIRLLLKKYPKAVLVITGCYAQVEPEEISKIDSRIAVLPGMNKARLAELPGFLKSYIQKNEFDSAEFATALMQSLFKVENTIAGSNNSSVPLNVESGQAVAENPFKLSTDTFLSHSRASLKIQDGCNCQCTYCRIHIARGKSVSLDAQQVINRVLELKRAGQKEVVITTVNIGQYRSVYEGRRIDFTDLLELLLEKTSGISFRLSSLYPEIVDERFAEIIKDERVAPHFHISLQSGSDRILKLMKRPYKVEQVYNAITLLKKAKNNPFIACDIIAGFPGETDEDFEQTMRLAEWAEFAWIHAFPFSARPGTEAYNMKPKIPQSVAGKRVESLLKLACKNKIEYISKLCGTAVTAIAERPFVPKDSKYTDDMLTEKTYFRAVTSNFLHCIVDPCGQEIPCSGAEIRIKIEKVLSDKIADGSEEEAFAKLIRVY